MGRLTDASIPFAPFGKEQTDAMTGMQKEILDPMSRPTELGLRA
jgi:hypothetical protein